jgi:methyltransferase
LAYARRNTKRLMAAGAVEHGAGHYPAIVALHGGWLAALAVLVPAGAPVDWGLLGLYGLLQVGRLWVIVSLGARWTTRVIVPPGTARVTHGPYRFLRHPNYLVVALEIPLLPLAFGAWHIALSFGLANLALLAHRIRVEERALAG